MFKNIFIYIKNGKKNIKLKDAEKLNGSDGVIITDCIIDTECPVIGVGLNYKGKCRFIVEDAETVTDEYLEMVYARINNKPLTISCTPRLVLREICREDASETGMLYRKMSGCEGVEIPEGDIIDYIDGCVNNCYPIYGYGLWQIIRKSDGKLIGRCGVENGESGEPEFGYFIAPEYRGEGYGYEACSFAIDYCREELAMDKIRAVISKENTPSIGLAKKLGFKPAYEQGANIIFINQMHI